MKKLGIIVGILGLAAISTTAARVPSPQAAAPTETQVTAANALQVKIDAVKKKSTDLPEERAARRAEEIEVSETELSSYVMNSLRDQIPVDLEAIEVKLTTGAVGADAQLNIAEPTGAALVDALIGGRHNIFIKGKLSGADHRGRFELEEVRVDSIPVPKVLVETLFTKYVKPKYPQADLKEPFELPWGIERITIEPKKARITY